MDAHDFREHGKAMVDFIADYMEGMRERPVRAAVQAGYMTDCVPASPPQSAHSFQEVMADIEPVIMRGVSDPEQPKCVTYTHSAPGVAGDSLAAPTLPRLLPPSAFLPGHSGRHAE